MRSISAAFAAAVGESHTIATQIDVLHDGETLLSVASAIDGSVTLDGSAATRGRLDLTLVDDGTLGLVPLLTSDPLAPYGNELRVLRGIAYLVGGEHTPGPGFTSYPGAYPGEPSEGLTELVSLGVFRIDDITVDDAPEGLQLQIAAQDRSARVIDARFEEPYQTVSGTNVADAILSVLQDAIPDIETDFATTTHITTGLSANEGDDRWKFAQDMATAIGMKLYFDGDGIAVLRPVATTAGTPVATIAEGEGGVLLTAARRWTRQGTYNRVIATGENTGETAPARGVATDDNPLSPTYYFGRYGKVPMFYSSPFIATNDQAADAAAAMLAGQLGTTQQVSLGAIVNPAYEPDDVITVTRQRSGIDEANILDQLTIPLSVANPMTCVTRAVVS